MEILDSEVASLPVKEHIDLDLTSDFVVKRKRSASVLDLFDVLDDQKVHRTKSLSATPAAQLQAFRESEEHAHVENALEFWTGLGARHFPALWQLSPQVRFYVTNATLYLMKT